MGYQQEFLLWLFGIPLSITSSHALASLEHQDRNDSPPNVKATRH